MKNRVNKIYAVAAILSCVMLITFSRECMNAALTGFDMWLCFVMPSVFPFFVCISFMRESGILSAGGKRFTFPLFVSCALSGAPSGSRLCSYLADEGYIKPERLSYYCAACNMVSPIFITGTLAGMTGSTAYVWPVLIGHYGASFLAILFINRNNNCEKSLPMRSTCKSFFDVLCDAISKGVKTSVQICGVIIFFTVVLTLIFKLSSIAGINTLGNFYSFLFSLVEMTNGVGMIYTANFSYPVMCSLLCFTVSFGGLCIMAQAAQVARIEPKKYLITKFFVACIAAILSYVASILIPRSTHVFSNAGEALGTAAEGTLSLGLILLSSLIGCGCVWLLSVGKQRRR